MRRFGAVVGRGIRVAAQELDLHPDAVLRSSHATARSGVAVRAVRKTGASVEGVDAGVVVRVGRDLRTDEPEPTGLELRLHERDVSANAFGPAVVDEDLRERGDIARGMSAEGRDPRRRPAVAVVPGRELVGSQQARSQDRCVRGRVGRGVTRGRDRGREWRDREQERCKRSEAVKLARSHCDIPIGRRTRGMGRIGPIHRRRNARRSDVARTLLRLLLGGPVVGFSVGKPRNFVDQQHLTGDFVGGDAAPAVLA